MKLPSFSEPTYKMAGYVCTGLVTISGLFLCYHLIFTSGWHISAEWNMFKSWLLWPLYIIGLLCAIGNLGKNHYSQDTIIETEYRDGRRTREKSNDIIDVMFGHIVMPILGHFVLEPLLIAAVIYYPLMCVVALVGKLVPYILAVLVLAVCFGTFKFTSLMSNKRGSVLIVLLALFLTSGFGYGGYAIYDAHAPHEVKAAPLPETAEKDNTANETDAASDEFNDEFEDTKETDATEDTLTINKDDFE